MMSLTYSIFFLLLYLHDFIGAAIIDLSFTAGNCDTGVIKPDIRNGTFRLTWNGQVSPNLCIYKFTGDNVDLCFQSTFYNLPFTTISTVQIRIKNQTRSEWMYDRFDRSIPRICVSKPHNMSVSVEVSDGYFEPTPITYLQLQITAQERSSDDSDGDSGEGLSGFEIAGIVIGVICLLYFCSHYNGNKGQSPQRRNPHPTPRPQNTQPQQNNQQPAPNPDPPTPTEIQPGETGASGVSQPPPPYEMLSAENTPSDPTSPPPSYEEVTSKGGKFPQTENKSPRQPPRTPTAPDPHRQSF